MDSWDGVAADLADGAGLGFLVGVGVGFGVGEGEGGVWLGWLGVGSRPLINSPTAFGIRPTDLLVEVCWYETESMGWADVVEVKRLTKSLALFNENFDPRRMISL